MARLTAAQKAQLEQFAISKQLAREADRLAEIDARLTAQIKKNDAHCVKNILAENKNKNIHRATLSFSAAALALATAMLSGCALFEPRIDVMPIAQATAQMPPAMREAMADLNSPAMTAALHRAQASVDAEK